MLFFYNIRAINVVVNSNTTRSIGYGNCDFNTNGEKNIISSFIKSGNIVFDVGANIGEWTLLALKRNPERVFSFEPIPSSFSKMQNKVIDNRVSVFNCAIGANTGRQLFVHYEKGSGFSSFYHRLVVERDIKLKPTEIEVNVNTIDNFCDENNVDKIDFLKIDTEGAEFAVLYGAQNMLSNGAINYIQFEYGGTYPDAGITLHQVYDLLTRYEYSVFRIISDGLLYIPKWENSLENYNYSNYFAVSKNKINEVL